MLHQYEVIAVVGTHDPQLAGVPWVGIEELLGEQGHRHLSQLLSGYLNEKQIALINKNMVREFSLHNVVNSLTILNAGKPWAISKPLSLSGKIRLVFILIIT